MSCVKTTIVISHARNRLTFSGSAQKLGENNYTLNIRPSLIDELDATVRYIERELRNPPAADKLIEQTYAAIDERLFAPESFEPCYRPSDVKQQNSPHSKKLVAMFISPNKIRGETHIEVLVPSFSPFPFSLPFSHFPRLKDTVIVSSFRNCQ